jgi:uncharacterized phage protein (TIGR01671 family)
MRDIKFRWWDEEKKEFNKPWGFRSDVDISVILQSCFESHIPTQYTGLKDKNGKDIYEGDLILSDHWASEQPMVVKWDQYACMFYACLLDGGDRIEMDEAEKAVVGNIFEGVDK